MKNNFACYQVSLKILLKKSGEFLFLTDAKTGKIDVPGGRIDDSEYGLALPEVIAREVREELGSDVRYILGKPILQFRTRDGVDGPHVFNTVYGADYEGGQIRLSAEHSASRWIDQNALALQKNDFLTDEAYFAFKKYFGNI